ncbi:hypothetical protein PD335_004556 [Salmonella enterica]|nr:hypothetical protein [Salmonella enterica subsp. enterica]EDR2582445.1 hypothetical protein [Salmonella enterica subsp. enterica serovar Hadar]EEP8752284.1 hypothetical protein [Salmonella enterica subsp. enterica serovar Tennessee]EFY4859500.1 hypothetical protein [Salmonella enterica]EGK7400261.1 hypothetical protein [Salmonella enterica subsp. enterica serovar Muenchen]EHG3387722.1 hypothetical protein [Salmonella enterica subsp. enterica serovar Lattenkamp]
MSHEINQAVLVCIAFMIFFLGWTFGAAINANPNKTTTIIAAIFGVVLIVFMIALALIV